jgi:hypothetical protein
MRNILLVLVFLVSCTNINQVADCETPSNGFIDGMDGEVKIGSALALDVFNEMDKAWAELDYDKIKTFVAEDAVMNFADGGKVTGPDEFVEYIKNWVIQVEQEDGNEYTWNTDYAFSLAVTTGEGDYVNAQFTSTHTNPDSELEAEVYYEYYHIVDGKVQGWNQFKRDVLK